MDTREQGQIKEQVQQQFGKNAEKYVTSQRHAKGADLSELTELARAEGAATALDIATGGGHVANALAAFIEQVTACDLTQEMLEQAQNFVQGNGRANVRFVQEDAETLSFADGSFDLAACRIAAHHFPNPDAFAREVNRVLKPGGCFLLIDNVGPEDDELDRFYNELEKQRDHSHVRAWKKSEWISRLERSGFVLETLKAYPKPFEFQGWTERMGLSGEQIESLAKLFSDAPEAMQKHFHLEYENGHITGFQGEAILVKARKRI
ncbi:class I SAM-dependent methyltransferase [Paenibacillus thalictri]|uniref:Class I SAM-dependent methyltransferase n=1 Tax=Paenibacillus thalictri TaxID=2527873 RepID=A0A4V2J3D4_9BACL|nr:class I SAM-dependent methyltransferase [Paenibacillus thalictri]TBL71392.1 class I SAM-dependent methyltransferase [Paenibacillus thalictri]